MGGLSTLRKLLVKNWCPTAQRYQFPHELKNVVFVDELLSHAHAKNSKTPDGRWTVTSILEMLCQYVRPYFSAGMVKRYIFAIDQQKYMPSQKLALQEMRKVDAEKQAADKKVELYEDECRLVCYPESGNDGIQRPLEVDRETGEVTRYGPTELIDLSIFFSNRSLRHKLWLWLKEYLIHTVAPTIPPDCDIILDHFEKITYYIRGCPQAYDGRPFVGTQRFNKLGEGDMKAAWWARRYQNTPVIVWSRDNDLMPILNHVVESTNRETPLLWCYDDLPAKGYVDMNDFHDSLRRSTLGLDSHGLIAACVLFGSDFVEKDIISKGIGEVFALNAVAHLAKKPQVKKVTDDPRNLENLMRYMYTLRLREHHAKSANIADLTVLPTLETDPCRVEATIRRIGLNSTHHVPNLGELKDAFAEAKNRFVAVPSRERVDKEIFPLFAWNVRDYWGRDWTQEVPPIPAAAHFAPRNEDHARLIAAFYERLNDAGPIAVQAAAVRGVNMPPPPPVPERAQEFISAVAAAPVEPEPAPSPPPPPPPASKRPREDATNPEAKRSRVVVDNVAPMDVDPKTTKYASVAEAEEAMVQRHIKEGLISAPSHMERIMNASAESITSPEEEMSVAPPLSSPMSLTTPEQD